MKTTQIKVFQFKGAIGDDVSDIVNKWLKDNECEVVDIRISGTTDVLVIYNLE